MNERNNSIQAVVSSIVERLTEAGVESPRLLAELLVSEALGCPRLELPLHEADLFDPRWLQHVQSQAERVRSGEPIQYVLGHTSFMGYRIRTDPRALIPRPETEVLVETVLSTDSLWSIESPLLADVGTGTGCIAIAVCLLRPGARVIAVDSSADALALASENVCSHCVGRRVQIRESDLLSGVIEPLDAVVSNPPYVRSGDLAGLPASVRDFEPTSALDAGPDGLGVIRRLIPQACRRLKPGGWLFLEIGETQGRATERALSASGFDEIEVMLDLTGRDRIVRARVPATEANERH